MKLFISITAWQDQFCEEVHFKLVTKGFALFSAAKDQERLEVCMG
jgi:hypothetical protein